MNKTELQNAEAEYKHTLPIKKKKKLVDYFCISQSKTTNRLLQTTSSIKSQLVQVYNKEAQSYSKSGKANFEWQSQSL